jgi:cytochrome c biogenesis protein
LPALIAAIAALAGLLVSFLVRRRRVFVRAAAGAEGGATVEFGGLARTESSETFGAEFEGLSKDLSLAVSAEAVPSAGTPAPSGSPAPSELPSSPDERE